MKKQGVFFMAISGYFDRWYPSISVIKSKNKANKVILAIPHDTEVLENQCHIKYTRQRIRSDEIILIWDIRVYRCQKPPFDNSGTGF